MNEEHIVLSLSLDFDCFKSISPSVCLCVSLVVRMSVCKFYLVHNFKFVKGTVLLYGKFITGVKCFQMISTLTMVWSLHCDLG